MPEDTSAPVENAAAEAESSWQRPPWLEKLIAVAPWLMLVMILLSIAFTVAITWLAVSGNHEMLYKLLGVFMFTTCAGGIIFCVGCVIFMIGLIRTHILTIRAWGALMVFVGICGIMLTGCFIAATLFNGTLASNTESTVLLALTVVSSLLGVIGGMVVFVDAMLASTRRRSLQEP